VTLPRAWQSRNDPASAYPPSMERESHAYASWPGLTWRVPANHVFAKRAKDVVGRHKGGHDDWCVALQRFCVLVPRI
jgi:hypothetical protein